MLLFLTAHRSPLALARRLGTSHAWELKTNMAEKISRVRPEHKFDEGALQEYLVQNLPGFPRNHGQWTVLQYRSVSCNVTGALVFIMFCISQCFGEKKLGCTWRARLVLANHRLQIAEQKKNEGWRKHTFSPANFKLANQSLFQERSTSPSESMSLSLRPSNPHNMQIWRFWKISPEKPGD